MKLLLETKCSLGGEGSCTIDQQTLICGSYNSADHLLFPLDNCAASDTTGQLATSIAWKSGTLLIKGNQAQCSSLGDASKHYKVCHPDNQLECNHLEIYLSGHTESQLKTCTLVLNGAWKKSSGDHINFTQWPSFGGWKQFLTGAFMI